MKYATLSKEEAQLEISRLTKRIKEIDFKTVDGIIRRMRFEYSKNGAGGTGRENVNINYKNQSVEVELKAYGCNYNQPSFMNEYEIEKALKGIGYSLNIESFDN